MLRPMNKEVGTPSYIQVRDQLRADIISGAIPADSRLTIADVMKRYNVSQMPVREAFQYLQGEGLLILLPHKGARVLSLSPQYVGNIYDIHIVLEGLLAKLSMPNLTMGELRKLTELHEEMTAAVEVGVNPEDIFLLNQTFHMMLYEKSNNPDALGIYLRYAEQIKALRNKYGFSSKRLNEIREEHAAILEALHNQDEDALEQVVKKHSMGAKNDLLQLMTQVDK